MAEAILVDGQFADRVPADDRGLAYGDGVFRTLRVAAGHVVAWPWHMQRLAHDCGRLQLALPPAGLLAADAERALAGCKDGVLKIIVTRGSGGRGYAPPQSARARRIVSRHALPAPRRTRPRALALLRSPVALAAQPALAGVKHLNRLEQVLARGHCERAGQADALMCDDRDRVIGTTMRNLFLRERNGGWLTPALTRAGVAGATRARLRHALAAAGEPVREGDIEIDALAGMTAALACNSIGGIAAVARIEGYCFPASEAAAARCRGLLASQDN